MTYRQDKFAPTLLVVATGGAALAMMIWFLGGNVVTRWFLYPSALVWIFSLRCLVEGSSTKWDRVLWRICLWWSGIWSVVFGLSFCAPPFSTIFVGRIFAPIAMEGGFNPFLAAFAHILIWACARDILSTYNPQRKRI